MYEDEGKFEIRFEQVSSISKTVASLRSFCELEISKITDAIKQRNKITLLKLFTIYHDETEVKMWKIIESLEKHEDEFDIVFEGEVI